MSIVGEQERPGAELGGVVLVLRALEVVRVRMAVTVGSVISGTPYGPAVTTG